MSITRVPSHIVIAKTRLERLARIENLLRTRPSLERWAVLITTQGIAKPSVRDGVAVRNAAGGCACCIGRVAFRVALTRLLREARPDRLIIELAADDHLDATIAMLGDEWFARAIKLTERIDAT